MSGEQFARLDGSLGDAERQRHRRLRLIQLLAIALPTLAILVATIMMARSINHAGEERRALEATHNRLDQLHHTMLTFHTDYWERRARGGGASIAASTRDAFVLENAGFQRLATARQGEADERPIIDELRQDAGRLATIIFTDTIGSARTPAEQDQRVREAQGVVDRLDDGLSRWTAVLDTKVARASADGDALTARLFIALGVLITLLVGVGTAVWIAVDRQRRAALRDIAAERDANRVVMTSVQDGVAVLDESGAVVRANSRLGELLGVPAGTLVGTRAPWLEQVPIRFAGETDITLGVDEAEARHVLLSASSLAGERGALHVLKDVTLRRRAEAELHNLAAEREVLRRVATFVAGGAEPAAVFDLVACEAATLFQADAAVVTRFDPQTDRTVDVGVWVDPESGSGRPPARVPLDGGSPTALVYRSGRPARMDDVAGIDATSAEAISGRGYRAGAAAPVQVGDVRWGAVAVFARQVAGLSAGVEDRLARFAELVGLTVTNADARARLAGQAATDPLTGLANHRSFHERLEEEVARARHDQTELALVMLDLDNFKDVNDTYGHQIGDQVLTEAARRLAGEARSGEVIGRIGGEEFAWILPASDGLNAWRAAERARRAIAGRAFGDGVGTITASAGVADLTQASDAATLMRLADGALYWAKASGRDATFRYSPEVVRELSATERAERLARSQAVTALRALARAVDAKDPSTARHAERVAAVAVKIGRQLGWDQERLQLLEEAALLHDVGKIGVADSLLFKPGRLTSAERSQIEMHATLGAEIVSDVLAAEQVAWVRGHHERWDGAGYPDGTVGDAVPIGARIIAVADAWDAMTSVRTYGSPRDGAGAIDEIARERGHQFCPDASGAIIALWQEGALTVEDEPLARQG